MSRLISIALGIWILIPVSAFAQQSVSWEDLAIQAQKSATLDQIAANAIISSLQTEIAALKAELAKAQGPKLEPKNGG